jgi:hypothetical protein
MKSKMQRSGVTSKTKALSGISKKLRDGSENRNRDNDRPKENDSYGYPGGPRYENMEKSMRAREEQMPEDFSAPYYEEDFNRPMGRDRFNEYAGNQRQASPDELRYHNRNEDEYYYRYLQPNPRYRNEDLEDNYYRRNYEGGYPSQYSNRSPRGSEQYPSKYDINFQNRPGRYADSRFRHGDYNPYGEHPASRGAEEYLGSNKRHSGLGNYNDERNFYQQQPYRNRGPYSRDYEERENYRNDHRHNADLEYSDYMNRGQYEEPFHGREMYDPTRSENDYRDDNFYGNRSYRNEGYQNMGNTEGFGTRGGRQQGHDWREEDEYREGHAPRKRGYGKYGSR